MKTIRILILEDDLKTLSVIMDGLFKLEESLIDRQIDFAVTTFSEYNQVQDYLNQIQEPNFDIILLDRDCKLGGSFHVINIKKFGADKFIAISTQPEYPRYSRCSRSLLWFVWYKFETGNIGAFNVGLVNHSCH